MQVICIIHWTNPGSNMQIEIMECWLVCHFACTIDSVELEQDFVSISGSLPGFKGQVESLQIFHSCNTTLKGIPFIFSSEAFWENSCTLGWGMTFSKCKKSTGSLVVFIPPKANTSRLSEHAQAHGTLEKYHFKRRNKSRNAKNYLGVLSEGQ